jgi:hypothetical protein
VVGHDDAEHRVTEELEPLVRRVPRVLGAPGAVGERGRELLGREVEPQAVDERLEVRDRERDGRS